MKNWKYPSGFLSKFWKVNKISERLTICEASSNQKSNPREPQHMNILLALAYHDRATFETFRQLELLQHQPLNSFFWLNVVALYSVWSYKKIYVQAVKRPYTSVQRLQSKKLMMKLKRDCHCSFADFIHCPQKQNALKYMFHHDWIAN